MLFEVCNEINNFFDYEREFGKFEILNHALDGVTISTGQYYRIIGSVFNDGVYKRGIDDLALEDEEFNGAVWKMAVPSAFLSLVDEIEDWSAKYLTADSAALSPFVSESFGGYSYSKAGNSTSGDTGASWADAFAKRLNAWRKPRCRY